ncbi:hypothetical protein ACP4OV_020413 [Aristida adscensionis]
MAGDEDERMRVILFPFPAQGHFAAFLSLAARLHRARPSAAFTLVSTPRNVAALRASPAAAAAPFLRFHALPFVPEEHGLPAGAESTDAVQGREFVVLFAATESPSLRAAFDGFLTGACADGDAAQQASVVVVVVADPLLAWTTGVARRRGARHAFFVSCGAFGSAVYHSLWNHLPHRGAPGGDATLRLPDHPEVTISVGHETDALVVNTTEELEPAGLRMLRRTMGDVPVLPIGPLVRLNRPDSDGDGDGDGDGIIRWLDARAARSVLYISFGSQDSLRAEQMRELAAALELTGRPFVWAIRPPLGWSGDGGADGWLPEGFEVRARAGGRGLLVRGWASQVGILAHPSTGAFLSHCGWNSVLESVAHGVPVVGWPLQADQFFNARMLEEEWGACVEVARGNAEGSPPVGRAALAEAVEAVMGDTGKGAEMRRRVREIQELTRGAQREDGGSSVRALEEFFASMLRGRRTAARGC